MCTWAWCQTLNSNTFRTVSFDDHKGCNQTNHFGGFITGDTGLLIGYTARNGEYDYLFQACFLSCSVDQTCTELIKETDILSPDHTTSILS